MSSPPPLLYYRAGLEDAATNLERLADERLPNGEFLRSEEQRAEFRSLAAGIQKLHTEDARRVLQEYRERRCAEKGPHATPSERLQAEAQNQLAALRPQLDNVLRIVVTLVWRGRHLGPADWFIETTPTGSGPGPFGSYCTVVVSPELETNARSLFPDVEMVHA